MPSPFPQRVRAARIQRGLTQDELAKAIGLSKQAVSQYENGRKKPESTTLIALADALNKPPAYFVRPMITSLDQVDFRKRASLKGKQLEAVKAHILDKLEPYLELESILGVASQLEKPLARKTIRKVEEVEDAAMFLLAQWKLGLNPIPNIQEMIEDREIKVVEVHVDAHFSGLSTWIDNKIPVIVLNAAHDIVRKRFTAMHELGHLLLTFEEDATDKFKEAACNRFAGALLLPGEVLLSKLGRRRHHLSYAELIPIKEYYGISMAATMYRCKDLGIIPDSIMRRFWQERNRNPELKQESGPYDVYRGEERTFRFEQLLFKALAEEFVSVSKAASLSGKSIATLNTEYRLI